MTKLQHTDGTVPRPPSAPAGGTEHRLESDAAPFARWPGCDQLVGPIPAEI